MAERTHRSRASCRPRRDRRKSAELGEITREGKDYVSVKPEGFEKAIRLKGRFMSSHSNVQSLSAKLAEKQATDRQQIEALTRSELDALAQTLKKQSAAALSTTLDAIESDLNKRLDGIKKQIETQTKPLSASLASVKAEAETLQALTFRAWLKRWR